MNISREIFELYSYVVEEDIKVRYYEDIRELEIQIPSFIASDFLSTISESLDEYISEDCMQVYIMDNKGTLCVELIAIMEYYCEEDEIDYWIDKFEYLEK